MTTDPFRPLTDPARSIYDALIAEASKRRHDTDWIGNEREVVWSTARDMAQKFNLKVPTIEDVKAAESLALGHVDFAAKWVYGVVGRMKNASH